MESMARLGCPRNLPAPVPAGTAGLTRRDALAIPRPLRTPGSGRFDDMAPPRVRDAEAAGEYAADMLKQMLSRETQLVPKRDFLRGQSHISPDNRATLVEWFAGLRKQLNLSGETLFLAVNIVDRYMSTVEVRQKHLQLAGAAAFLIAAKLEEIKPPDAKTLVYYTADAYTRQQLVKMEIGVLGALRFEVASPTALHLLVHLQSAAGALGRPEELRQDGPRADSSKEHARRILECSLTNYPMAGKTPSQLACAALLLGNEQAGLQPWPESLMRMTGYSRELLEPLADDLHALMAAKESAPRP